MPTPELLGVGMRRRDFIAALGAAAAWPCSAASWASRFDLGQETHQAEQAVSWLRSGSRTPMMKIILMIGAILMLWSSNATAQERVAVAGGKCRADLQKLCRGIPPGNDNLRNCMREHLREVSLPCAVALARFATVRKSHPECGAHLRQQCKGVKREGGEFEACLKSAIDSLSHTCKDALGGAVRALVPK